PCRRSRRLRRAARPPREPRSRPRTARRRARTRRTRAGRRPRRSDSPASRRSGGHGCRRWRSFLLLGLVEVAVLLVGRQAAPIFPCCAGGALGLLDAGDEAAGRAPELELGVGVQPPRDVHAGEEKVAELLGTALVRARVQLRLQLGELVLEVG